MPDTENHRYDDLLMKTLEEINRRIESVEDDGRTGRRALREDIGQLRAEIAATREEIAGMRVRLGVVWAAASTVGGALVLAVAKLLGMR